MTFLEKSERLWKARHAYRQAQLNRWVRILDSRRARLRKRPDDARLADLIVEATDKIDKWDGLRDEASYYLRKRRKQLSEKRKTLTTHFDVSEFDCHDGREVPEDAIPALRDLARDILEPLRAKFGEATVTSGYRPGDYNRRIGGATHSVHIYDVTPSTVAADVKFQKGKPADWAAYARRLGRIGGVGQYSRTGFIHVDNDARRDWWG